MVTHVKEAASSSNLQCHSSSTVIDLDQVADHSFDLLAVKPGHRVRIFEFQCLMGQQLG